MDGKIELTDANKIDLKLGKTARVTVDPADFGVKEVLIVGIRLGEAETIQKIIDTVEVKAGPNVSLEYIKMMNQPAKAKAVADGEGAAKNQPSVKDAVIPEVDKNDNGMEEYLRQQQNKDTKGDNLDIHA